MWAHFYDPHAPYTPPADARARAGGDAYGGEVAYADAEIGRLLSAVAETGGGRPSLIVILGDHGESLGEHGERTHGMLLYDGALRIPLVMAGPGVSAGEHRRPVSIVDVAPTVLRLAGISVPAGMQGRDLLAAPGGAHEVYAETLYPRTLGWSPLVALVEDRWKVIAPDGAAEELYSLDSDPAERENAAARRPEAVQAAVTRLAAIKRAEAAPASAPASAEVQERLRALGYVGTAPPPRPVGRGGINPAAQIATWVAFEEALEQLNAGAAREALATLAALHAANPGAQVIAATYANALSEQGRHRQALAIYRDAVRSWPGDSMLFHDFAVAAQRAGLRDEATRAEQAAIALDPKNGAAHNGLGLLLVEAGRVEDASRAFERAAAADPSSAEYLANLGNARRAAGDRAGAEAAYRSALASDAGAGNALNGLGVLLVETGRPRDAIPLLERAAASDPAFLGRPAQSRDRPSDRREHRRRGGGLSCGRCRGAPFEPRTPGSSRTPDLTGPKPITARLRPVYTFLDRQISAGGSRSKPVALLEETAGLRWSGVARRPAWRLLFLHSSVQDARFSVPSYFGTPGRRATGCAMIYWRRPWSCSASSSRCLLSHSRRPARSPAVSSTRRARPPCPA